MAVLFRVPPLLLPLCHFICGIAAAVSFGVTLPDCLLPLALCITAPLLVVRTRGPFLIAVCATLFIVGNTLVQSTLRKDPATAIVLEQRAAEPLLVEGVIVSRPVAKDGGRRLIIRPERVAPADAPNDILPMSGLLLLRIGQGGASFATGDRIRFQGKLKAPRNFGTPGEFDIERFYALKGVVATAFVKSDADILPTGQDGDSVFTRHFDRTAADIGRFITDRLPGIEGGVMKALLIGDTADIPQQLKDQYSLTGVNHILSISGFHVGIIALALFHIWFAVSRLFPAILLHSNFRRFALLLSVPPVIYYLFLSGAAPATARSVIMLCLLAVSLLREREADPVNSLALAAFALLLINPAHLYDVSFQFSFLALWGLIVITPLLAGSSALHPDDWGRRFVLFAAASTAAVTVTLLPVAYYFQQTSLTGIISNFFIVPLLGYGAVVTGFAALPLIWLFPPGADTLLSLAALLVTASNRIIAVLAEIPALPVFIPSAAEITLFLIAMLLLTIIRSSPCRRLVLFAVPLALLITHQFPDKREAFSLRVDFLSVGQGESTLITFADGQRMLIDGGGALFESGWDIGRQLLLPTLRKAGVDRIDYLVLTHSHPDHLHGVKAVAESLPVGEFWESGLNTGDDYRKLREVLKRRKVAVKIISSGSPPLKVSGTEIRCLYPLPRQTPARDMNENSLVLRLEAGGSSLLFTGDIGFAAEADLLHNKSLRRTAVLKVPHHGSRYSTGPEFLAAVSPETALISAGYNNSFGLPAQETVEQLAAGAIKVYRTDRDGTISLTFPGYGKKPVISTFKRQNN